MRRIVSLWLPHWPTDRLSLTRKTGFCDKPDNALLNEKPLALVTSQQGGMRITAVNRLAVQQGLYAGQLLTEARALVMDLAVHDADPQADEKALVKLSRWCGRYTPWTKTCADENGTDGIFLDITGCAHLFGGEEALLQDLQRRLAEWGLDSRLAVADTAGAAWAAARYGKATLTRIPPGKQGGYLPRLPVAALRLDPDAVEALRRMGLKTIGQVLKLPRAPLVQRFGKILARRLDQALGKENEPIDPEAPHVPYRVRRVLAEPVLHTDYIATLIGGLAQDLVRPLNRDGQGARQLKLWLYRVDGHVASLVAGTARPSNDPVHLARLFAEKLDRLGSDFDAGFGIEVLSLEAMAVDPLPPAQLSHGAPTAPQGASDSDHPAFHQLVDRLSNRFGLAQVMCLEPKESHIPERAVAFKPVAEKSGGPADWRAEAYHEAGRPIMLLPCAEPIEVVAEVPEGPPRRFQWRRVTYQVAQTVGPERVAPEWWREEQHGRPRDYYCLQDGDGRRFWVYRDGLYQAQAAPPRWYMHGFFA